VGLSFGLGWRYTGGRRSRLRSSRPPVIFHILAFFKKKKLRNEPTKKLIFRFWPIGTIDEGVMSVYVARLELHSVKQPEH
jgi:hypothetical protein